MSDLYLALDAATNRATIALGSPGHAPFEQVVGVEPHAHAGAFLPAVHRLLGDAGARIKDLDGVVVADGPGSFTGLRIAAGFAKGLVHGADCALYAVPSLAGCAFRVAQAFAEAGTVAALYDALRGDVFLGLWGPGGARVVSTAISASDLARVGAAAVAGGPGALVHEGAVRAWTGRAPVGPPVGQASAGALLAVVWGSRGDHEIRDPAGWEPEYGRPAEAQVRWEARHGRSLSDSSRSQ